MDQGPASALSCEVLVVGAGLAGLVAAIGFARAGFDVVLPPHGCAVYRLAER